MSNGMSALSDLFITSAKDEQVREPSIRLGCSDATKWEAFQQITTHLAKQRIHIGLVTFPTGWHLKTS